MTGELAYGFIDMGLQYMLPDGWRWEEEDEKDLQGDSGDDSNNSERRRAS